MQKLHTLRQQRKSAARGMTLLALGGIVGVLALAAVALWVNMPNDHRSPPITTADPMSMVG